MYRAFYLIALTVATIYVLECAAVPAGIKDRRALLPVAGAQQQPQLRNTVDPNDVEFVDPIETSSTVNSSRATARNQLFDNIFKVRIFLSQSIHKRPRIWNLAENYEHSARRSLL